nr:MAG TPA: hypothetical protein [Caudoviricetes sp.]
MISGDEKIILLGCAHSPNNYLFSTSTKDQMKN